MQCITLHTSMYVWILWVQSPDNNIIIVIKYVFISFYSIFIVSVSRICLFFILSSSSLNRLCKYSLKVNWIVLNLILVNTKKKTIPIIMKKKRNKKNCGVPNKFCVFISKQCVSIWLTYASYFYSVYLLLTWILKLSSACWHTHTHTHTHPHMLDSMD